MYCVISKRGVTLIIYRRRVYLNRIDENLDLIRVTEILSLLLLRNVSSSRVVLLLFLYIVRTATASSLAARVILTVGVIPVTGIVHSIYIIVASIAS